MFPPPLLLGPPRPTDMMNGIIAVGLAHLARGCWYLYWVGVASVDLAGGSLGSVYISPANESGTDGPH